MHAVVAIAAVEVAAALLLLPWAWEAYRREHGDGAVYMAGLLIAHGASACLLLSAGRRDRRTRLLGVFFLLKATLAPMHMLPAFLCGMGSVYTLARDIGLDHDVAVKTLAGRFLPRPMGL